MATIKSGLNQFVFNGEAVALNTVPWLNSIRAIYRVKADNSGWISFRPGRSLNSLTKLEVDGFYFVDAVADFHLPDAQILACATGTDALIPAGISQFLYAGEDLTLGNTLGAATAIYQITPTRTGWISWKSNRTLQAVKTLIAGNFYLITAAAAFTLAGAQNIACAETYGSEKVNAALYVKYPELLGAIPAEPSPKTAPNMVLYKATLANYYIKSETYSQAQIDAIFQGVEEVISLPTFDDFPQPGLPSTLYIDEEFNVGYRWSAVTGYVAVSSPGVDLTPYLTKTEAANTYQMKGDYLTLAQGNALYAPLGSSFTKLESDNKYQLKGAYAQSLSIDGGALVYPSGTGNINLLLSNWFRARPNFSLNADQVISHDTSGNIIWIAKPTGGSSGFDNGYVGTNGDMYDNGYVSKP